MPEIRVDLPGGDGRRRRPVAERRAAPGRAAGVVVQLRPGDRRDRRRRTDPHWLAGPRLRIRALGRTEVLADETALGGRWLAQRPGQMLKYLVSQRTRSVLLDEVAYALWPDSGLRRRRATSATRCTGSGGASSPRAPTAPSRRSSSPAQGAYSLSRDHVLVDADEFEDLVRTGLPALESDPRRGRALLERALDLYRGDFLADEPYAEWALDERGRLRDLAARVLHTLARIDEQANDSNTYGTKKKAATVPRPAGRG